MDSPANTISSPDRHPPTKSPYEEADDESVETYDRNNAQMPVIIFVSKQNTSNDEFPSQSLFCLHHFTIPIDRLDKLIEFLLNVFEEFEVKLIFDQYLRTGKEETDPNSKKSKWRKKRSNNFSTEAYLIEKDVEIRKENGKEYKVFTYSKPKDGAAIQGDPYAEILFYRIKFFHPEKFSDLKCVLDFAYIYGDWHIFFQLKYPKMQHETYQEYIGLLRGIDSSFQPTCSKISVALKKLRKMKNLTAKDISVLPQVPDTSKFENFCSKNNPLFNLKILRVVKIGDQNNNLMLDSSTLMSLDELKNALEKDWKASEMKAFLALGKTAFPNKDFPKDGTFVWPSLGLI